MHEWVMNEREKSIDLIRLSVNKFYIIAGM